MQKMILVSHRVAIKIFKTSGAPSLRHTLRATTIGRPKHASSVELSMLRSTIVDAAISTCSSLNRIIKPVIMLNDSTSFL